MGLHVLFERPSAETLPLVGLILLLLATPALSSTLFTTDEDYGRYSHQHTGRAEHLPSIDVPTRAWVDTSNVRGTMDIIRPCGFTNLSMLVVGPWYQRPWYLRQTLDDSLAALVPYRPVHDWSRGDAAESLVPPHIGGAFGEEV